MKASRTGFNERSGNGGGAPPTDLLVCFPSRAHLTLMPKPICSPSRPPHNNSDMSKRSRPRPLFRTQTTNRNNRANGKTQLSSDIGSEPTSPEVTCAGQIKVRHKNQNLRHIPAKNWVESLGLKKDVMNFLGALRSLRFNMTCFGSFHGAVDCCSDEEGEEEVEEEEEEPQNVFSKWFMLLEENEAKCKKETEWEEQEEQEEEEVAPPKNALLLMRCRSAPAKGWLEAGEEAKEAVVKEEAEGDEERLMLMSYAPDFFKLSTEIAKETWVVGSVDPLARSRSWRR